MDGESVDTGTLETLQNHLLNLLRLESLLVLTANMCWAVCAFYALIRYNRRYYHDLMRFGYITFVINAFASTVGLSEMYNENVMNSMRVLVETLESALALPCLTTEIWLKYRMSQPEVAYLHAIIGVIPVYIYVFQHYTRQDLIDFTVSLNVISLALVGFFNADMYVMTSSFLVFVAYGVFFFRTEFVYEPFSKQLYYYDMALFSYCAMKSAV